MRPKLLKRILQPNNEWVMAVELRLKIRKTPGLRLAVSQKIKAVLLQLPLQRHQQRAAASGR